MPLLLKDLYAQVRSREVVLVAGEKGLQNPVSWTHTVETEPILEFLLGREIVFTTGLSLNADFTLLHLVQRLHQKHASGVILNLGPYIETVPNAVLDYANRHGFPVFTVPWSVYLADLNRIFCFAITKYEQNFLDTAVAFQNAMLSSSEDNTYINLLLQKGYGEDWQYQVALFSILEPLPTDKLERIAAQLEQYASYHYAHCIVLVHDGYMVVILCNPTQSHKILLDLHTYIQSLLQDNRICLTCAGERVSTIRQLHHSYIIARKIARLGLAPLFGLPESTLRLYEDLGIYCLLLHIDQPAVLEHYVHTTLLPLLEYDSLHKSDLIATLTQYLQTNGSVQKTAELSFVHRNTINYKVKKMEELLGKCLSDTTVRTQLSMGLMAYRLTEG